MQHLLASVFNIRPGEGRITALLFVHSFCVGMATDSFSTAASALFLATFDVGMLPYVYIGSAGIVVLIGVLYTRLQVRLPFPTLLTATLVFLLLVVCAFRLGLWLSESKWVAFGLLVWLRMLIVLANLEFWGLTGRLFNVRQGKRLFSLIGSGELTASILGGFATPSFVMFLGTPNLLLVSACGLLLSVGILRITLGQFADQLTPPQATEVTAAKSARSGLIELMRHPYIVLIILSNVLMVIVYNFIDYTFYDYTKGRFQDEMHLAIFIGPFFAVVQIVNVLTKTFLSSRLFNRFGLRFGLLAHPLLLIALSVSIAGTHRLIGAVGVLFWLVVIMKLCDEVLWTSIYDPSLLILYQPLPTDRRRAVPVAVQSIFGPLSMGLSGGVLLLLGTTDAFTSVHLAYIVPVILAGALVVARLVNREYPKALTQALTKRTLEEVDLSLQDGASLAIVQQKLHSPYPGEIVYALELLERSGHACLTDCLIDLLEHPWADIRRDVLRRIERVKAIGAYAAVVQRVTAEAVPPVRAAAVRAWCALGEAEIVDAVSPFLHDPQSEVRMGAMVGLLRYGGIEGILAAGECLILAAHAPDPTLRAFAARGLGEVGLQNFYQPLVPLLHDDDPMVRRTALTAAGNMQQPKLWPVVLEHIATPDVGHTAVCALVAGGESTLPALATAFTRAEQDPVTRVRIARIWGRIRGERAIALLRDYVDMPDVAVRTSVLVSLGFCGYQAQDGDLTRIRQQITQEVAQAAWVWAALADIGEDVALSLLWAALRHDIDQIHRRLFILLSFIFDRQAMHRAWENFSHASAEKRAYALEIIDVLVTQELKAIIMPLLEDLPPLERLQRLRDRFPQCRLSRTQRLQDMVSQLETVVHPWTRACALYSMAQLSASECVDAVVSSLSAPEPLVRETALWTLARLDPVMGHHNIRALPEAMRPQMVRALRQFAPEGQAIMLTTIEKVIILKAVPIFAETPDEALVEVASLLDEIDASAGETIIEKGDMGSCMYIIVDGEVRVHDGERTLRHLGNRDIFGELAVLDPEPRSASVTAIVQTRLFRLDQDAIYELMADRIEVARGIIRVLCQQLRSHIAPGPS